MKLCVRTLPIFCVLALGMFAPAAMAGPGPLPSGQEVSFFDQVAETQNDGETWLILRYLAPRIAREGGDLSYADVSEDLDLLCDIDGIKTAKELGGIDQIVITLMDRPMERGASDPDATMFIGAYLPGEEGCIWQ